VELIIGSMAVKLKGKGKGFRVGGERKPIKGFSSASRRNMLWRLQTLDYDSLASDGWTAWFITLTYRDSFYKSSRNLLKAKQDLDKFFIYLSRLLPLDYFSFWKLEFTKKGIPHFHLFMCVRGNISHSELILYVQKAWLSAVSPEGEDLVEMEKASTNVRFSPLDKSQILAVYISKEIGKTYQVDMVHKGELPGRFWGIYNRKHYKAYVKEDKVGVGEYEFYKLRRILRNWLYSKGYKSKIYGRHQGATAYYVDADGFSETLLRYLGVVV